MVVVDQRHLVHASAGTSTTARRAQCRPPDRQSPAGSPSAPVAATSAIVRELRRGPSTRTSTAAHDVDRRVVPEVGRGHEIAAARSRSASRGTSDRARWTNVGYCCRSVGLVVEAARAGSAARTSPAPRSARRNAPRRGGGGRGSAVDASRTSSRSAPGAGWRTSAPGVRRNAARAGRRVAMNAGAVVMHDRPAERSAQQAAGSRVRRGDSAAAEPARGGSTAGRRGPSTSWRSRRR